MNLKNRSNTLDLDKCIFRNHSTKCGELNIKSVIKGVRGNWSQCSFTDSAWTSLTLEHRWWTSSIPHLIWSLSLSHINTRKSCHLPTMMPQALTSPISFLSATPPTDEVSPAASLAEPAVLLRCLGPSVMLEAVMVKPLEGFDGLKSSSSSYTLTAPDDAPPPSPCARVSPPCVKAASSATWRWCNLSAVPVEVWCGSDRLDYKLLRWEGSRSQCEYPVLTERLQGHSWRNSSYLGPGVTGGATGQGLHVRQVLEPNAHIPVSLLRTDAKGITQSCALPPKWTTTTKSFRKLLSVFPRSRCALRRQRHPLCASCCGPVASESKTGCSLFKSLSAGAWQARPAFSWNNRAALE